MKAMEQAIKELSPAAREKLADWLYHRMKQGLEQRTQRLKQSLH